MMPMGPKATTPQGVDERARTGKFPLAEAMCWNHMTYAQQVCLRKSGLIGIGEYGGGFCNEKAEVQLWVGRHGSPRFYCRPCAINLLDEAIAALRSGVNSVDFYEDFATYQRKLKGSVTQ